MLVLGDRAEDLVDLVLWQGDSTLGMLCVVERPGTDIKQNRISFGCQVPGVVNVDAPHLRGGRRSHVRGSTASDLPDDDNRAKDEDCSCQRQDPMT